MRILQVFPHTYTEARMGGGILQYVRNISERLVQRHEVTIYATNAGHNFLRHEIINGVQVERFRRFAPNKAYFFSLEMLSKLKNSEFDVVHGHCYQAFPLHFSVLAKRKKFVASTHFHGVGHSTFRNFLIKTLKPFGERTLRAADKIVAVSEYEKSLLCQQFRLDSSKITVIPCGVNLEEFKSLKKTEHDRKSILYVGRLENYKGLQFLIEVLPRLDKDSVLKIIGKGSLREALQKRARELNVSNRVTFYEELPRTQLLQNLAEADVFVLLSKHEAYSMAVAEALASGTPCVVAQTSALAEWVDGEHCFGVQYPICIDKLARLINETIQYQKNPDRREFLSKKIMDWDNVVNQLESVYQD